MPPFRRNGGRTGRDRAELADGCFHSEVRNVQRKRRADADALALAVSIRVCGGRRFARCQRAEHRTDGDVRARHVERINAVCLIFRRNDPFCGGSAFDAVAVFEIIQHVARRRSGGNEQALAHPRVRRGGLGQILDRQRPVCRGSDGNILEVLFKRRADVDRGVCRQSVRSGRRGVGVCAVAVVG
ncbi:hypothetical protein SDC9_123161 [bioreactor metagenome]|uniref:Uncharacterized protein n=1 Tax=bioreactor metagenome TaxID=1076179 RepID=A0A645CGW1_9ZZZZ